MPSPRSIRGMPDVRYRGEPWLHSRSIALSSVADAKRKRRARGPPSSWSKSAQGQPAGGEFSLRVSMICNGSSTMTGARRAHAPRTFRRRFGLGHQRRLRSRLDQLESGIRRQRHRHRRQRLPAGAAAVARAAAASTISGAGARGATARLMTVSASDGSTARGGSNTGCAGVASRR